MAVLDGRHAAEERERTAEIKASLLPPRSALGTQRIDTGKQNASRRAR